MAIFHGSQSQYELNLKKFSQVAGFIWLGLFVIVGSIVVYLWLLRIFSIMNIIVIAILFAPIFLVIRKEMNKWIYSYSSFRKGLKGAGAIWYELHNLSDKYEVYQHCKLPGRIDDIDFIVVGPTGVFVIEVKSHSGKVEVNGDQLTVDGKYFDRDFLRQVKIQYQGLHNYLLNETGKDVFVHPILVFSNRWANVRFGTRKIRSIEIIKKAWLIRTICQYQWFRYERESVDVNQAIEKLCQNQMHP
jgi:hypothetical protein